MKIKPFIRWAGGKQKSVDNLLDNTPDEKHINKYYEPFLGAGSLFFANGFEKGIISDINPQLINCYIQIRENPQCVYEILNGFEKNFDINNNYYYEIRSLFNLKKNENTLDQAARFIFLIHTNYNGMYRVNSNGDYNVPIGKTTPSLPKLSQLELISDKLHKTKIECFSYHNIFDKLEKGDFIYLDPPYPPLVWSNYQKQYTEKNFSKRDHEDLADFANEAKKKGCYLMISYPDIPFVKSLYDSWNIEELNLFRSISCKKERKTINEIIIKNY